MKRGDGDGPDKPYIVSISRDLIILGISIPIIFIFLEFLQKALDKTVIKIDIIYFITGIIIVIISVGYLIIGSILNLFDWLYYNMIKETMISLMNSFFYKNSLFFVISFLSLL